VALQVVIIQVGSIAFYTSGLTGEQWGICIAFSAIAFVTNFILKLIPLEVWFANIWLKFSKRNKIADPEMVVDSRQQINVNVAESEQNPLNAHQLEKKSISKPQLNEILRKPSKTNSIVRSASKNFYKGKNEDM
jgi:hypothetical protein